MTEEKSEALQNMNSANVGYVPLVLRQDFTASTITGYSKISKDVSEDGEQQQCLYCLWNTHALRVLFMPDLLNTSATVKAVSLPHYTHLSQESLLPSSENVFGASVWNSGSQLGKRASFTQ